MRSSTKIFVFIFLLIIGFAGCASLKVSKPIIPVEEYEKLLVGRLDANYVGTDNCLASCHYHDKIRRDFEASTMGAQMSSDTLLPLVNCESCHGPGSLAVEGLTPEEVAQKDEDGYFTQCNYETLIDLKNLPSQAQSLICLKCHSGNSNFNLHNWTTGAHAISDVSCFECHDTHAGPMLIVEPQDMNDMCFRCHQQVQSEFLLPSRHPLMEKRIFCSDCHDNHGTVNDGSLVEDTVKETCTRCHGEKEGPFFFEHADVNEDCSICHRSHGSINNNLLVTSEPFLCLQCHGGHRTSSDTSTLETKGAFYTRCTDCHSQIHGTDIPSATGKGFFIN